MKKIYKDWYLGSFYMSFTYDGLISGSPSPSIDKWIIDSAKSTLKRLLLNEDCVTIIEKREEKGALKPVMVLINLYKYEPQIKGYIITFCDHNDSIEDVIERVIEENPNFKTIEWEF